MTETTDTTQKYHPLIRILHWLMALIIFALLVLGFIMEDFEGETRYTLFGLHKSLGVTILVLAVIRISIRFLKGEPEFPIALPSWQKLGSALSHWSLYALFFLIPLSGYMMSNLFGYGVSWFGLELPFIAEKNKELGEVAEEVHELLAYAIIGIIALHIGAAIFHKKKHQINILKRIT